ncbi:ribonuclease H-like domain-containing protein [Tanacetum coccineum]
MYVHNSVHNFADGDNYIEDPVTLISRLDISDPLHLHPNDFTALSVVSIKLKGTKNYQVWSCAMHLSLEGKNKNSFIDGSCKRSNTDEHNGSSIAGYYHKLNALWKQFDDMVELPKCVCNASESFKKHNQLKKLMQFLMGLDDSYMQIKSFSLAKFCLMLEVFMLPSLVRNLTELLLVVLLDLNLRNVLGIGNQCEGLYYNNNQEPVLNALKDSLQFDNKVKQFVVKFVKGLNSLDNLFL